MSIPSDGNDTLTGISLYDVFIGSAGNDTIDGGPGFDTVNYGSLTGAGGNPQSITFRPTGSNSDPSLSSVQKGSLGTDRLTSIEWIVANAQATSNFINASTAEPGISIEVTLSGFGLNLYSSSGVLIQSFIVENFDHVIGTNGNDSITGDTQNNRLIGGAGDDRLDGLQGNDTILGEAGADSLRGGSGDDSLNGGAGNDSIEGNFGNDTLNGGAGADTMIGGDGDDTYVVDNSGDIVTEINDDNLSGIDSVFASINYTLGSPLENLTLTGTALSGTGNSKNNVLTGNSGNNLLSGGSGADTLTGGAGFDTLTGGNGPDTFVYNALSEGGDTITDWAGSDRIQLDSSGFAGLNLDTLAANRYGEGASVASAASAVLAANSGIASAAVLGVSNGANVEVWYTSNTSNLSGTTLLATLTSVSLTNISQNDFWIVD